MSKLSNKVPKLRYRPSGLRRKARNRQEKKDGAKIQRGDPPRRPRVDLAINAALFPGEDRAAYAALHYEMMKTYQPCLPPHFEVVARATGLIWRIRRIPAFEAAAFSATARSLGCSEESSSSEQPLGQSANVKDVWDALLKSGVLTKIAEYEVMLREQLKLATAELQEIMDWNLEKGILKGDMDYILSCAPDDPMWVYRRT
jgi:hypothetical protein